MLDMLARSAAGTPEAMAFKGADGAVSYSRLLERSRELALKLEAAGLREGDCLMVSMRSRWQLFALFFAATLCGAVFAPVNSRYKPHEISAIIRRLRPAAYISDRAEGEISGLLDAEGAAYTVMSLEEDGIGSLSLPPLRRHEPPPAECRGAALLILSSGSTGEAKAAAFSAPALLSAMEVGRKSQHSRSGDVVLCPVPLCHMYGFLTGLQAFSSSATVLCPPKFDAAEAWRLMESERVSSLCCVPTMYERMICCYAGAGRGRELSALRYGVIAGSASSKSCIKWFYENLGCPLLNAYGMSEINTVALMALEDPYTAMYSTCGRPTRGTELRIVGQDGKDAPPYTEGEILCRSERMMLGYYRDPRQTAAVLTADGWLKTGDIGKLDGDGYLVVTGRKKDLIIRGGFNISPAELENLLLEHPAVLHACVFGTPDRDLGEKTCVCLELKGGEDLDAGGVRAYIRRRCAGYKVPDYVFFTDSVPKLENGKLDKKRIKEQYSNIAEKGKNNENSSVL